MTSLETRIGGVMMKNPVAAASGTFGYGEVFKDSMDPALLGAVVVKGLSPKPRAGNPPPRMTETPSGMLNSIGLENIGVEAFIAEKLPWLREKRVTVIANIFGEEKSEYVELAERLSDADGVAGLELNVSCPNVKAGGIMFGSDPKTAAALVAEVKKQSRLPVWVKLSPNVSDIAEVALAVEAAGADAISLINTLRGMAIDIERKRPVLGTVTGGLSGPAIKPVALRMVYETASKVKVPVVGMGGISTASDAIEFLLAGARAVQVGTANFVDPSTPLKIISGIRDYMDRHEMNSIEDINRALQV